MITSLWLTYPVFFSYVYINKYVLGSASSKLLNFLISVSLPLNYSRETESTQNSRLLNIFCFSSSLPLFFELLNYVVEFV